MIGLYIRLVGGVINLFEQVFFWPTVGRFLKKTIMISHSELTPMVIVGVGINRGQSTFLFLKWFPKARIYGFEPLPNVFNLAERKLADRVQLYNLGVSSISGVQTFWESKLDETSTFNHPNLDSNYHKMKSKVLLTSNRKMYKALKVNTVTLDDFSRNEKIIRIDLLKVDTEGHELEVLKGSADLLMGKQIGLIQIERQETGLRSKKEDVDSPVEVEDFLKAFSYFKVNTIGHVFANFYDDFYTPKKD